MVAAVRGWQAAVDAASVELESVQTAQPASAPGGVGNLNAQQLANARTIIDVGRGMGLPQRAQVIALATAAQESTLRNLDHGDRDSLGLFQQRPSQGWGTPAQIEDPVYASTKFYQALQQVPNWQNLPVTVAAQKVQHSAFPGAYAKWEPLADELVRKYPNG